MGQRQATSSSARFPALPPFWLASAQPTLTDLLQREGVLRGRNLALSIFHDLGQPRHEFGQRALLWIDFSVASGPGLALKPGRVHFHLGDVPLPFLFQKHVLCFSLPYFSTAGLIVTTLCSLHLRFQVSTSPGDTA